MPLIQLFLKSPSQGGFRKSWKRWKECVESVPKPLTGKSTGSSYKKFLLQIYIHQQINNLCFLLESHKIFATPEVSSCPCQLEIAPSCPCQLEIAPSLKSRC